jgi:hypothetical protein
MNAKAQSVCFTVDGEWQLVMSTGADEEDDED